jgi:hypothetical protein
MIKLENLPKVPVDPRCVKTQEEMDEYNRKVDMLYEYGVNIYLYTDGTEILPEHPDGIHNYWRDSSLAIKLVLRENKELPEDLKERLLYYKEIMGPNWENVPHRQIDIDNEDDN